MNKQKTPLVIAGFFNERHNLNNVYFHAEDACVKASLSTQQSPKHRFCRPPNST